MSGLELQIGVLYVLPVACQVASTIFEIGTGLYTQFKTTRNITPGTEAQSKEKEKSDKRMKEDEMSKISVGTESQIKQQDQMMREMRDEMRQISIGTKSQIKQQGQIMSETTESHIKQQGQMMSEMRDEMRDISITSKLSSERISQVFTQVHIFNHLSIYIYIYILYLYIYSAILLGAGVPDDIG